jgi:hypothetical protein
MGASNVMPEGDSERYRSASYLLNMTKSLSIGSIQSGSEYR